MIMTLVDIRVQFRTRSLKKNIKYGIMNHFEQSGGDIRALKEFQAILNRLKVKHGFRSQKDARESGMVYNGPSYSELQAMARKEYNRTKQAAPGSTSRPVAPRPKPVAPRPKPVASRPKPMPVYAPVYEPVPEPMYEPVPAPMPTSAPWAAPTSKGNRTRAKLPNVLHSCAGLPQQNCEVAPNCFWQPKANRCSTKSGAPVVKLMGSRAPMLQELKAKRSPIDGQTGGGYWW
jgi:hypothetical protein